MTDYLTDAQNDIKAYFETHNIPTHFYQCFLGELVKVWGIDFLIPDENYFIPYDDDGNRIEREEDTYSYRDQIACFLDFNGGTGGWHFAFKDACDQCGLMDIYDDYSQMNWVYSDTFDGYIADKMLEVIFDGTRHNDYYRFKMKKEKQNESN